MRITFIFQGPNWDTKVLKKLWVGKIKVKITIISFNGTNFDKDTNIKFFVCIFRKFFVSE